MTRADQRYEGFGEAQVPDQSRSVSARQHRSFGDTNRLRAPETLTKVFEYQPTTTPFTDEEELIFTAAFRETPKDFGKIAAMLPGRTEKECLQHYYAKKGDGRFKTITTAESKEKAQTVPRQDTNGTGPGRARVAKPNPGRQAEATQPIPDREPNPQDSGSGRAWDPEVPPIDQELSRLNALIPRNGKLWRKAYPLLAQEPRVVPRADLSILRPSFDEVSPFHLTDEQLLTWLRSGDLLPLVKQWTEQCMNVDRYYVQLQRVLLAEERPWDVVGHQIAKYAKDYGTREVTLEGANNEALLLCARSAKKICNGSSGFFEKSGTYTFSEDQRYLAASRVVLTAYDDLRRGSQGFFGVLLEMELAGLIKQSVRKAWEKKYPFEGEVVDEPKRARKRTAPQPQLQHDASLNGPMYMRRGIGSAENGKDSSDEGSQQEGSQQEGSQQEGSQQEGSQQEGNQQEERVSTDAEPEEERATLSEDLQDMQRQRNRLQDELEEARSDVIHAGAGGNTQSSLVEQLEVVERCIADMQRELSGLTLRLADDIPELLENLHT